MKTRLPDRTPPDYTTIGRTNDEWPDHQARKLVTAALLAWMRPESLLDPACGDGSIVLESQELARCLTIALNDISPVNVTRVKSEIDSRFPDPLYTWLISSQDAETSLLADYDKALGVTEFDVIVLTEILEHLEDPEFLLRLAATRGRRLLVSSPEMRPGQIDSNPEHLWMYDGEGYEEMLNETGWKSVQKTHLTFRSMYDFQIWVCDRDDQG